MDIVKAVKKVSVCCGPGGSLDPEIKTTVWFSISAVFGRIRFVVSWG